MKKGVFCISIDTELLWGRKYQPQAFTHDAQKVRSVVKKLLRLFKKYEIPVTWAIVAELFTPGSSLWHAPAMIKAIQKSKNQEIACHSFSHLIFDEKKCPAWIAEKEIQDCLKIAKEQKIKFKSFVFPFNRPGYLKILKKHGFRFFRGPEKVWFNQLGRGEKLGQIIDFLLLLNPPVSPPIKDRSGLINIPNSMYFISARGLRKLIPPRFRLLKAKKGLNTAVKKKAVFHLWFHAIDLTKKTKEIFWELEEVLKYAVKLRKEGKLAIKSMAQTAV